MWNESISASRQGSWAFSNMAVGLLGPRWDVQEDVLKPEEAESAGLPGNGALLSCHLGPLVTIESEQESPWD